MVTRAKTVGTPAGRKCWLLQMSRLHDPVGHSARSSEHWSWGLCCVFIRAEFSGWLQWLWASSVVFPLHWRGLGHVWWLIEHENTWRRSARKPWNCQPSLPMCSRVLTQTNRWPNSPTLTASSEAFSRTGHSTSLLLLGNTALMSSNSKHCWRKLWRLLL